MTKFKVEYKKDGKKVCEELRCDELKRLLKDVVKIQISTRYESFEIKDSILEFLKKYKKYGVKNLSEKYNTTQDTIRNKLISLGLSAN
jgi:hypothetical protein